MQNKRGHARGCEFVVLFPPEIALKTGNVIAAEALLRWVHPKRGVLEPAAFVLRQRQADEPHLKSSHRVHPVSRVLS